MLQSYEEARDWIHNQLPVGIKPGLQRMEWMMEQLDHPERRIKCLHIGGTNGKGSTVAYLRNILQEAGYVVGTFTSPYIEIFNERIAVNGIPISNEEFLEVANIIKPLTEELSKTELGCPTEFEVITAISIVFFGKISYTDIVLFEVGLGGRLDSTNIIHPLLSIITNIGYDHMRFLGDTIQEIAYEKAGIIKNGVPVLTAATQGEVLDIFENIAEEKRTKLYQLGCEFDTSDVQPSDAGITFSFDSIFLHIKRLELQMKGSHQVKNAALAIQALSYLEKYYSFLIDEEHIRDGLFKTIWIGRFEKVCDEPIVIIDGAHNEEGMQTLAETLQTYYPDKRVHVIFSALGDKPIEKMLQVIYPHIVHITFTSFQFPRALKAIELMKQSNFESKSYIENYRDAIQNVVENLDYSDDILVITGSLYFISEVRKVFKSPDCRQNN